MAKEAKKKLKFKETFLGDLVGADGKLGIQGKNLRESLAGARRKITPEVKKAAVKVATEKATPKKEEVAVAIVKPVDKTAENLKARPGNFAAVATRARLQEAADDSMALAVRKEVVASRLKTPNKNKVPAGSEAARTKAVASGNGMKFNKLSSAQQKTRLGSMTFDKYKKMTSQQRAAAGLPFGLTGTQKSWFKK